MATFTINTSSNNLPGIVGNYSAFIPNRGTLTLTKAMFTTSTSPVYSNPGGETPISVLLSPPSVGSLKLNGVDVTQGQEINFADIDAGLLVYSAPESDTLSSGSISFSVRDSANVLSSNSGNLGISAARKTVTVNYPPVVGNNSFSIPYSSPYTFGLDDFTTKTSPAYFDPEGDGVEAIEIYDLNINGGLKVNGLPVVIGQDIAVADIPNLVYEPDDALYDSNENTITYRVKDTGSGQYSNEGVLAITVEAMVRNAPVVADNSAPLSSSTYQFKREDVTNQFVDADNNSYLKVKFLSLPPIGTLTYLGSNYVVGTELLVSNISGLKYTLPAEYTIENGILYKYDKAPAQLVSDMRVQGYYLEMHQDGLMIFENNLRQQIQKEGQIAGPINMTFQTSDNSVVRLYSNTATFTLNPQGDVNLQQTYINEAPQVTGFSRNILYGQNYNFSVNDFLNVYSDKEGDQAVNLKIEGLPSRGQILLNGATVSIGQEIPVQDLGTLVYVSQNSFIVQYDVQLAFSINDAGSTDYSNIAQVTIAVDAKITAKPTVSDNSGILNSNLYTFSTASFTKDFADGDGDSYHEVHIKSLPQVGVLKLLGVNAVVGTKFLASNASGLKFHLPDNYIIQNGFLYKFDKTVSQIVAENDALGYKLTGTADGKLTFTNWNNQSDVVTVNGTLINDSKMNFQFLVTDNSTVHNQSNIAVHSLDASGDVNVPALYVNLRPIVGDNMETIKRSDIKVFKRQDFVEDTDPKYSDPEGDQPYQLRINTLPSDGILSLRGVPITAGQVLNFVGDVDSGTFIYTPDVTKTIPGVSFSFDVSDTGNRTFPS